MIRKDKAKELFLRDKAFLKELYKLSSLQSKKLLNYASDSELKTLVYYIYFISSGEIPFKKELFKILSKVNKIEFLHKHFSKEVLVRQFLKEDRKRRLFILHKLNNTFNILLKPLFKE